jgi:hypothetical protein
MTSDTTNRIHISGLGPGDVALLKNIAVEAAEQTTRTWLLKMGLNPDQPIIAQENFVALRQLATPETRTDLEFLRRWRPRLEGMPGKVLGAAITIGVLGAAQVTWANIKMALGIPSLHP